MTNIIEIIMTLAGQGHLLDAVIHEGHLYLSYKGKLHEITNTNLADSVCLIAQCLNDEMFGGKNA